MTSKHKYNLIFETKWKYKIGNIKLKNNKRTIKFGKEYNIEKFITKHKTIKKQKNRRKKLFIKFSYKQCIP